MKIGQFDTDKQVYIIAEIGNNHEGNISVAEELIGKAAEAGANAVKFQTIVPELFVSPTQKERFERLKKFQLSYAQFESLAKVAKREGVQFLSTPFDIESAKFLNSLVPAFKIASGDNNFVPLLETVCTFQKPIVLSTGLSSWSEIQETAELIKQKKVELAVLHCVVSYPTPLESANLLAIEQLKKLGSTVGYSDHTIGIQAAVLSVGLGARIIEKHFTLRKDFSDFRDHHLSSDPTELKTLIDRVREAELILGSGTKRVLDVEVGNTIPLRRSIVAATNLKKGKKVSFKDLTWLRPGTGLAPGQEKQILDKELIRDIQMGEPIQLKDVA